MPEKSKRELFLKLAAVVCVCGLLGDRVILTPMVRLWDARTKRTRDLELALGKERALLAQDRHWSALWAREQKKLLPGRMSEAESLLLESLNRWARDSGLRLTSVRPRGRQDVPDFRSLEVQASATGRMSAIARFLYALETAPLALAVEDLEVAAGKQGSDSLSVNLRVTGLVAPEKSAGADGRGT